MCSSTGVPRRPEPAGEWYGKVAEKRVERPRPPAQINGCLAPGIGGIQPMGQAMRTARPARRNRMTRDTSTESSETRPQEARPAGWMLRRLGSILCGTSVGAGLGGEEAWLMLTVLAIGVVGTV